ncbi:MAG: phosphoribosylformylglycinamidine synthase subunit PurS [Ignavibacteriaceae bacterium]|jgi:phosphoribosylformylglycinamidine synthase PurS subunit
MFRAKVLVKRRPSILDPQGKAVEKGAEHLGLKNVRETRIGKYIEFIVDTADKASAENEVNEYCHKLLANPIMEDYEFTLEPIPSSENQARAQK